MTKNKDKNENLDSKSSKEVNPEKKAEKVNKRSEDEKDTKKAVKSSRTESVTSERRIAQRKEEKSGKSREKIEIKITGLSAENIKEIAINVFKILLPIAACVIVVAVIITYIGSKNRADIDDSVSGADENAEIESSLVVSTEPLKENSYSDINELMSAFYTALAEGDMETVKALKVNYSDQEIITYEERSKFIESYSNLNCYTKPGVEEDTYFAYVTYDVKINDIETMAPGLNAWFVYKGEDGSFKIEDVDLRESIYAAYKLINIQEDVVDLFNKIDVSYKEAIASDEALDAFMEDLDEQIKTSVGFALAQLEAQRAESDGAEQQTETVDDTQSDGEEDGDENDQQLQNQTVNQIVRATATVNVRSSDSEEAEKIGKAQEGSELVRIEERVNGWSKVIFEGKEAYIKSDYLEVVSSETVESPIGKVVATTNVNVRSEANQESEKLGTAQSGSSYDLLEDQGEWLKISYNGMNGFVKAEFFDR